MRTRGRSGTGQIAGDVSFGDAFPVSTHTQREIIRVIGNVTSLRLKCSRPDNVCGWQNPGVAGVLIVAQAVITSRT